jgi:hypothetical protein
MDLSQFSRTSACRFDAETVAQLAPYRIRSKAHGVSEMRKALRRAGHEVPDERADSDERADAVTDFTTSALELLLTGAPIRRGMDGEFIFVPGRAATPVLPSRSTLPNGVRNTAYPVLGHTGQAQWANPEDTRSLPFVGTAREKKILKAEYYGIAYRTNTVLDWEHARMGVNDRAEKQNAANYELDKFQEQVDSWGNNAMGIPGAFSLGDANIVEMGVEFSGFGVAEEDMVRRIRLIQDHYKRLNGGALPEFVVLPGDDVAAMQESWFGTGNEGPSVWDRAVSRFGWLNNAQLTDRLADGSPSGGSRWMLGRQNPDELFFEMSETMVFGPFQDRMNFDFIVLRRTGGAVSKRPERVTYADFTPTP